MIECDKNITLSYYIDFPQSTWSDEAIIDIIHL